MTNVAPIVIVGSGMAGYTLARELRKLNNELPISIICRDSGDNYSKPTLSNAFAQNKSADNIAIANHQQMAENLNLTIHPHCDVIHIDKNQQILTINNLTTQQSFYQPYQSLVLATGANPKSLSHIQPDQQHIFAVNHLDDYRQFRQTIDQQLSNKKTLNIAIIGAGLIGCEFANDLISQNQSENTVNIHIFDQAEFAIQQLLPNKASQQLQSNLEKLGILFHLGVKIQQIEQTKEQILLHIKQNNQTTIYQADIILLAIGLMANTELAKIAELTIYPTEQPNIHQSLPKTTPQGIAVNQFLQTSDPNIYAIGDCANVLGSFMPYVMPLMNQAKALAKTLSNPTEPPTAVHYPAMPIAIKTPACPLVVLPVPAEFGETTVWQEQPTEDGAIFTAYNNHQQLIGFVLVGKEAGKQRMSLVKQITDWLVVP